MAMRRRLILVIAVALALGTAGAVAVRALVAGDARDAYVPPPLAWSGCYADVQCAELVVPLDHDDPTGETISLSVARQQAADPAKRLGVLVFVLGGPGGSGTIYIRDGSLFSASQRAMGGGSRGGAEHDVEALW